MRAAAVAAVRSLGHDPIAAEAFGAGVTSPRVACLEGVRNSDLVILILGGSYGAVQPTSGVSATHEEYLEAKDRRPIISFVQEGVEREPQQANFIVEVEDWSGGLFRDGFRSPEELRDKVTQAIHRYELTSAATPVDPAEMLDRATAMIPSNERTFYRSGGPLLHIVVVGGPAQTILRPVEIERAEFAQGILRDATYGDTAVFDSAHGSARAIADGALRLSQQTGAEIQIDERGSIRISVPVARGTGMMGVIIEENVAEAMQRAIGHTAEILARIDETQRLSRFVIVVSLQSSGVAGWRTRREDEASPNSMTMSHGFGQGDPQPVHFQPPDRPRPSLTFDRDRMVEDLVTLLRRQWS